MIEHVWVGALLVALLFWYGLRLHRLINEQKRQLTRMQQKLEQSEQRVTRRGKRLDLLLETMNEAVLRLNMDGQVKSINPRAQDIFRLSKNPPLPQPLATLYRDPDWLAYFTEAMHALPARSLLPKLYIHDRVLKPKLTLLGKNQALLICMDVTQEYQLQQQRSVFLSNLMHDLKTPLTSLLGYARSMQTFSSNKALRKEATAVIVNEARHVNGLLDALLCVDQIEHGKPLAGQCDLTQVLTQVWGKLDVTLRQKEITLKVQPDVDKAMVPMHEIDCLRVISNVASNAVHYSNEKSIIHCCLRMENKTPVVVVCDQGVGISDHDLPHITERFYRGDATRARGGHGLGLAIVHETLKRDGGSVSFEHNQPKGLCVTMCFPY
ncbi:MAG: ATP-binding protein [Mariprofundaceae bacterium]|nr:ATP-binding protein [Mariprofundaceae bacterium]